VQPAIKKLEAAASCSSRIRIVEILLRPSFPKDFISAELSKELVDAEESQSVFESQARKDFVD
jgi:hypothetical protein